MFLAVEQLSGAGKPSRKVRVALLAAVLAACLTFGFTASAKAGTSETTQLGAGVARTTYTVGPLEVTPGQNRISYRPIFGTERPAVDGWITRIQPNLVRGDGSIPLSSKVMFHHGVWLNQSRADSTYAYPERFYATGEEKTIMDLPDGYGYRYEKSNIWILNHMLHNLTPEPMTLFVTYTIDFIPDGSAAAAAITPVRPIWMDIDNGSNYPVFDVHRGDGGNDGEFTYPEEADNPYPAGVQKNEWTVDRDGVLLHTTGHVHSGGLSTDLYLRREGASYAGPKCAAPRTHAGKLKALAKQLKKIGRKQKRAKKAVAGKKLRKLKKSMSSKRLRKYKRSKKAWLKKLKKKRRVKAKARRKLKARDGRARKKYQACRATQPSVEGNRVHLFESGANYFEPAGPVSWDVAMLTTRDDWRVQVKAGDTLDLQTTYEAERASWPESMGINVVYMSDETNGADPYRTKVDTKGVVNHGHYEENDDHGGVGGNSVVGPDPANLPDGIASGGPFSIGPGFTYERGDFRLPGAAGRPPVVKKGQSFTFELDAGDASKEIWHSLTSCKSPCNKSTGIAYPIPDGEFQFESGQLGTGGAPTVNRTTWSTPANLPVGTHTYYCRIHPLMRGAFRVKN